jgi:hypothetical protein
MKVNTGTIPPHGYHFVVNDLVTLRAGTYDLLIKTIGDWRTTNGIPIGDPERDLDNYVCSIWPTYCVPEQKEQSAVNNNTNMYKHVNAWAAITMRDTPAGGYDLVDQKTAEKRMTTCISCPFNKPWRKDCVPCMKSTDAILIRLRQLRKITLDDNVLGCAINGFDIKTAIHLPDSAFKMTDDTKAKLPQNCWLNNTTT